MEMWEDTDLGEGMEALGIKEKTLIINASPSRGAGARNGLSCAGESTLWCDLDDNSPEEPRQPDLSFATIGAQGCKSFETKSVAVEKNERCRVACTACHQRKVKCISGVRDGRCERCEKYDLANCVPYVGKRFQKKFLKTESKPKRRKRLADSVNVHQGQSCQRTFGCLRPHRHPGHCRKTQSKKRCVSADSFSEFA